MNFLQLCQRVRQEAGISGSGPTTTVNQTGEMRRVVDWVQTAWLDVQNANPDWLWMQDGFSFSCTVSQAAYTPVQAGVTDFASWIIADVRVYTGTTANEYQMTFVPYADFKAVYMLGTIPTGRPTFFTVMPDKSLRFYPTPDAAYTIYGDYQKTASDLSGDTDTPGCPDRFHMIVVYGALKKYARYEAAPEVFEDASIEYKRFLSNLAQDQLAEIGFAGPLA